MHEWFPGARKKRHWMIVTSFFFVSTCMDTAVLPGCWNTSTVMSERKCNSGVHTLHPDRVLQLASLSFYHIWHGISIAIFFHLIVDFCKNWYGTTPVSYTHLDVYKRQVLERTLRLATRCRVHLWQWDRKLGILQHQNTSFKRFGGNPWIETWVYLLNVQIVVYKTLS